MKPSQDSKGKPATAHTRTRERERERESPTSGRNSRVKTGKINETERQG